MTRRARAYLATVAALAVAVGVATTASGGGPQPVNDGRYSGGAKRFLVFFDVNDRKINFARVYAPDLQPCTGLGGPAVFDSQTPVGDNGRFRLRDDVTHADNQFRVMGRFTAKARVAGKIKWTTQDNCPAGTYEFEYTANRHARTP